MGAQKRPTEYNAYDSWRHEDEERSAPGDVTVSRSHSTVGDLQAHPLFWAPLWQGGIQSLARLRPMLLLLLLRWRRRRQPCFLHAAEQCCRRLACALLALLLLPLQLTPPLLPLLAAQAVPRPAAAVDCYLLDHLAHSSSNCLLSALPQAASCIQAARGRSTVPACQVAGQRPSPSSSQ